MQCYRCGSRLWLWLLLGLWLFPLQAWAGEKERDQANLMLVGQAGGALTYGGQVGLLLSQDLVWFVEKGQAQGGPDLLFTTSKGSIQSQGTGFRLFWGGSFNLILEAQEVTWDLEVNYDQYKDRRFRYQGQNRQVRLGLGNWWSLGSHLVLGADWLLAGAGGKITEESQILTGTADLEDQEAKDYREMIKNNSKNSLALLTLGFWF